MAKTAKRDVPAPRFDEVERHRLERRVEDINSFLNGVASGSLRFRLRQPASLTVKRNGVYTRKAYIGGESFELNSAYVGKRDGVILVFEDLGESTRTVEIPEIQAHLLLSGYSTWMEDFDQWGEEKSMSKARAEANAVEHQAHEQAARARNIENPVFGSW